MAGAFWASEMRKEAAGSQCCLQSEENRTETSGTDAPSGPASAEERPTSLSLSGLGPGVGTFCLGLLQAPGHSLR